MQAQVGRHFEPTSSYSDEKIEGFTVHVSKEAVLDRAELGPAMALLRLRFSEIVRRVPPEALKTLRTIPIWVEKDDKVVPCMCYHPNADWLVNNGLNPAKVKGVELSNLKNFVNWSIDQPMMVLHEYAHGYHDLRFGFDGKNVLEAYQHAMASHLYDEVAYYRGKQERAYAANNQQEYFAELSEALFGYNDFYPFTRPELEKYDPVGYQMVKQAWGLKD